VRVSSPPLQSENQQKLKIMNDTILKGLIKKYEKEIFELRNRISDSDETFNEGGYGSESDYNYDQTRWGHKISTLTKVIKDLGFLLTLN